MPCVGWRLLGSTQSCLLQGTSRISLQVFCVPLLPTKRAIWKSNVSDFIICMYLILVLVLSFLSLKGYSWVWLWKTAQWATSLTLYICIITVSLFQVFTLFLSLNLFCNNSCIVSLENLANVVKVKCCLIRFCRSLTAFLIDYQYCLGAAAPTYTRDTETTTVHLWLHPKSQWDYWSATSHLLFM